MCMWSAHTLGNCIRRMHPRYDLIENLCAWYCLFEIRRECKPPQSGPNTPRCQPKYTRRCAETLQCETIRVKSIHAALMAQVDFSTKIVWTPMRRTLWRLSKINFRRNWILFLLSQGGARERGFGAFSRLLEESTFDRAGGCGRERERERRARFCWKWIAYVSNHWLHRWRELVRVAHSES